jgi:hypothetical protein
MATYKHLRSSTANKRPTTSITDGQLAINTNTASPGLFFKDSAGTGIVKVGPVHVGTTAPNATPAAGGSTGNYTGEQWLDTSVSPAQMKVWNGSAWVGVVADELPVSKLQDGAARQLLQTDAAGTGVEWTSNVDVPGTLDVTSTATFDSIARHPLGSAAAPTLTFTGDPNTGIYSPGADQVAVATNGTGRLFVDASGNVGVGAPSTSALVQLLGTPGTSTTANLLRLLNGSPANAGNLAQIDFWCANTFGGNEAVAAIQALNPNAAGNNGGALVLAVSSNGTATTPSERARIDSSGRLLVGTSTSTSIATRESLLQLSSTELAPNLISALSVRADIYGPSIALAKSRGGGTPAVQLNDTLGTIIFSGHDGTDTNSSGAYIIAAVDGAVSNDDLPTRLVFSTTADGASSPTERVRITSAGSVGIGTTSPGQPLEVVTSSGGGIALRPSAGNATQGLLWYDTATGPWGFVKYDHQLSALSFGTVNTERARIDSSGRLLVGTSSARSTVKVDATSGNAPIIQLEGSNNGYSTSLSITNFNVNSYGPALALNASKGSQATPAAVSSGGDLGFLTFNGYDGANFIPGAHIAAFVDGTPGANDMPGRIVLSTTADGASSPTEACRITSNQDLQLSQSGSGIYVGTTVDGAFRIGRSSYAVSTGTLYIGNAAIQVSSDIRLKDTIQDTSLNALEAISKIKVKDFTWSDPSDTSYNNRNARGKWTGLIAQELVDVLPFVVNAPRKEEDGSIDHDSDSIWTLDQSQLCPVIIKAVQQQQEIITALEARLTAAGI